MAAVVSQNMVDPNPTSAPPIAQSMDSNNPNRSSHGESPAGAPTPESPDRSAYSTPSPSRQIDLQSQSPSRVEEYRQLFRLPPDEVLIQDFNCALQENFLLQGHIYLFVHCICFYSNLFGFETKKVIPFHEVTSVRRAKAVAVFPTAIEVIAGGKKYFFTSFLSRDEAFKLINDGWLQHGNGPKEITDQQEPQSDVITQENGKSEIISQENGSSLIENSGGSSHPVDESDIIESRTDGPIISENSELLGDAGPEIISISSEIVVNNEEPVGAARSTECSSSGKNSTWEPVDADAPEAHEGYTKIAESNFPIKVEEFFNLFFSDDGVEFQETFHKKCGDKDFKCTSWRPHEKFGYTRDVSFQHPIKIYFGARFGSCQETQRYRVYRNCHLIVDTSQEISDVPYGDYFNVEARWDVEKDGNDLNPGCILRVYLNVAFSKKTMWRGKIVQSTLEECREAYAIWVDLAHDLLKQKNLEKEAGLASTLNLHREVLVENIAKPENHVEMKANDAIISQIMPELKDVNQVTNPAQEVSFGSLLRDTLSKFISSLKRQNSTSLLLVITIAVILLLMQISILVLLSKPQRIHIIPQADCSRGMSADRAESLVSLNKQIKYLKEEMDFVETLLNKMQHEHALLKGKLRELELFRN